jgi:hypothetical protein
MPRDDSFTAETIGFAVAAVAVGLAITFFVYLQNPSPGGLLDDQRRPRKELLELFILTGVSLTEASNAELIVQETQRHWFQGREKERWEFHDVFEEDRKQIIPLLRELGVVDAIHAKEKRYRYGVVFGALASRMEERIDFLVLEWRRGVRFEEIVFLTGNRPLLETEEHAFIEVGLSNESQLTRYIWGSHKDIPDELRSLPLSVVDACQVRKSDGTFRRPSTGDTIEEWLRSNPEPAKVLTFSNQPYVGYQRAVMKRYLPQQFKLEAVGAVACEDTPVSVYLDTLARILYEAQLTS